MPEQARSWHERTPKIVCLGLSALDYIWAVERLPVGSDKVLARQFATKGGGMAATAAVAVARLGGHASFWGRAGDDLEGCLMRQALQEENVEVGAFRLFPDARSSCRVSSSMKTANGRSRTFVAPTYRSTPVGCR